MEFIVKIGADQANLNQTIARMKSQCQNMNASVPMGFARPGYMPPGGAQPGAMPVATPLLDRTGKLGMGMGMSLLRANIWLALTQLLAQISAKKIWDRVYGTDDETMERIKTAHEKLLKTIKDLTSARATARAAFTSALDESLYSNATPQTREAIMRRKKAEADSEVTAREKEFADAQQALADAKSGRAFIQTAGGGRRMIEGSERLELSKSIVTAETKLLEARKKQLAIEDKLKEAIQGAADAAEKLNKEVKPEKAAGLKELPARGYQADAMAQAGLFGKSSLMYNPQVAVEREQLDVLRRIESNTAKGMFT